MIQANVNGKKQDIIITNSFKNSEFEKLEKKLPYSVLEYLFINKYKYSEIKKYLDYNDNITVNFYNDDNVSTVGELKVLSKFRIDGDTLENLLSNNKNDSILKLDLEELSLDSKTIKRGKYPFYAIVTLKKKGNTFFVQNIEFLEAISINIDEYKALRKNYTSQEWLNIIFSTIGYNADTLTPFEKYSLLIRLIPFCIEQYHIIELGNKETAKSYFYSVMSDLVHSSSISAGSITIAKLVRNNSTNEPGILAKKNVINFDEIPDAYWKDNDIVTILQTYLQDGVANRDDGVISGKASLVFTGNLNNFESSALKKESLFNHFKAEIRNETIIDKLYFFSPGWKFTKINPNKYNEINAPRIRRDYFLCALNLMREESKEYSKIFEDTIKFIKTDSGRDMRIVSTIAGLIMLLHPDIESMSTEELEAFAYIAFSGRKMLLRELEIKNKGQYKNELEVQNSQINKNIEFDVLSNFIINTSETLLKSHNISIDNIEYYYLDYYKDYDITKEINKQYGFELVEPTIVIKCTDRPTVYKLAISSYGINMNILEVHESKTKDNITCKNLTENFMLIETNEIKENVKKLYVKKFAKSSISTFKDLKEKYKKQSSISDIIDILISEHENHLNLSSTIRNLENKLEIQSTQLIENQENIEKLNLVSSIKDILNLISFSQPNLLERLYDLRNQLTDKMHETLDSNIITEGFYRYYLGKKKYRDYKGYYNFAYNAKGFDQFERTGKIYIETKLKEALDPLQNEIKTASPFSSKDEFVDKNLKEHINSIDKILDYIQGDSLIAFVTVNHENNLEKLSNSVKNLESHISSIEILTNNSPIITDLLRRLNTTQKFYSNFSTYEISSYFELLNELYEKIKSYMTAYLNINNQKAISSSLFDNINQETFDSKYFDKTIFDNNYITQLKNSQN